VSQENVVAVRRSMDGWNRGDVDAWLRAAHQEVEFSSEILKRVEGDETVLRGTVELRRFWDEWHSVWNLTIDVSEIRDLGDTVVALGRIRTRGKASGIDLEGPVAYVFEFDGGLARKVRAYLDQRQASKRLGWRSRRWRGRDVEIVQRLYSDCWAAANLGLVPAGWRAYPQRLQSSASSGSSSRGRAHSQRRISTGSPTSSRSRGGRRSATPRRLVGAATSTTRARSLSGSARLRRRGLSGSA
jgi:ketosteroid isomerase-like protein